MRGARLGLITVASALTLLASTWSASAIDTPSRPSTSYTWVGSSQDHNADNHSWTDIRNWEPEGVPGDGDSVAISPPDQSHCVAHVDGVPSGITLQDFSLTVGAFCGASINGGSLTIAGSFTWDSGVIATPVTLAAGSVGSISGFVTGNPRKELMQNLVVNGALGFVGANVEIFDPESITIAAGGVMSSTGTTTFTSDACCVTPAHVVNTGTINVTDGSVTFQNVQFDQNGHLDAAADAVTQSVGAPMTAGDGATYTGAGRFQIWNGATAKLSGTQNLGAGFHLELGNDGNGGSALGGTTSFAGKGEFDWTGGTLEANLTIAHAVATHVYGANPGNGKRILSGQDGTSGGAAATVVDHGPITVDQHATLATASQARLEITSGATLSLAPGTTITSFGCCVNPDSFTNTGGTVVVPKDSAGAGPAVLTGVAYVANGGKTQVAKGSELQLAGGPQSTLSSTTITGGGRLTVADPTAVSGTTTISGTTTTLRLVQGRGSLDGTATFAGAGRIDWQGGGLSGAITIANAGGLAITGTLQKSVNNVGGGSQPSVVEVDAPVTFSGGKAKQHNLLNIGSSTFTVTRNTSVGNNTEINGGTLVNTGTLTLDPGSKGTVYTDPNLLFTNLQTVTLVSGTVASNGSYAQAAGTTTLAAGTTFAAPFASRPLTVNGGTLTGTGTVSGNVVNNAGTVDPGIPSSNKATGTLTVTGTYTQGAAGRLAVDIAATRRDVLAVAGVTKVDGTLLSHTVKGYSPTVGDSSTVLTAPGGLTWTVACAISSGTDSDSGHWAPTATSTALAVTWQPGSVTTC